ncbi:MAG: hypothetical protein PWQ09_1251, partial [Candidatus Cloacimonadota bacterium]|nr:hypothetical protein [Candidatus Cloacimonadota bacterium]
MKRLTLMILLSVALTSLFAVQEIDLSGKQTATDLISSDNYGLRVNYEISKLKHLNVNTEEGEFTEISIPGYTHSHRMGEPQLPEIRKIISVPLKADVEVKATNFTTNEYSLEELGILNKIMPAQPSVSKSANPEDIEFIYNPVAYSNDQYNRAELVAVEELGILRGMRLFALIYRPIRYNPVQNTIIVYNNLEAQVTFRGGDYAATRELRERTFSPYFEATYQQAVFNYSYADNKDDLVNYPVKYVVISDPMFEEQLQPFVEWKMQQGYNVIEAYTDDPEVGSTTTSIKAYIQSLWDAGTPTDPAPSFILFCGDTGEIPAWSGDTGSHITDLDYVALEGGDYMPEIYYGRFSASNNADMQPQIDKTLMYEKYEMSDPSYLGEVTMIAGVDASWAPTHANGQINYGTEYYFNEAHGITSNTYLYPESGSSAANIVQDVSDGVGYINYTAHGSSTSWANPSFTISDINGLSNSEKYTMAVGNCCLTNKFEVGECFGEAWLRAEDKGAIGYIGGTNSTYWNEDFWWGVGYTSNITANPTYEDTDPGAYDGMFHDHGEPFSQWYTTTYGAIMAGNLAVVESGSSRINYYWEIYSIMGDPSLQPYFGVPDANTVDAPATIFLGLSEVQITADPYSYVGLSMDGEICGQGLVGESGVLNMQIDPFTTSGMAKLVITRQNREPYIQDIEVIPNEGPYLIIDDYTIDAGGDEIIEFGETVSVSVNIENVGVEDATDIEMNLTLDDEFITLTDASETLGDISAETIADYPNAFEFTVDNQVPDGYEFTLAATMTANEDVWTANMYLTAYAPVLEVATNITVDDGDNGRLDPGDTADLY